MSPHTQRLPLMIAILIASLVIAVALHVSGNPVGSKQNDKRDTAELKQVERRNMMASAFIAMLIGLAFEEMVTACRESVKCRGGNWSTAVVSIVFFVTCTRFFIGNLLHLVSDNTLNLPGVVWFYDFVNIAAQSVLLVGLGGLCTDQLTQTKGFGFFTVLCWLYALDIFWIVTHWLFSPFWAREIVPWPWAILNSLVLCAMCGTAFPRNFAHSHWRLNLLLAVNVVAFAFDVFLVDFYDVI